MRVQRPDSAPDAGALKPGITRSNDSENPGVPEPGHHRDDQSENDSCGSVLSVVPVILGDGSPSSAGPAGWNGCAWSGARSRTAESCSSTTGERTTTDPRLGTVCRRCDAGRTHRHVPRCFPSRVGGCYTGRQGRKPRVGWRG